MSGEFNHMLTSGTAMSFESLSALMDSMGEDVSIKFISEDTCNAALRVARANVNFATDWNMDDQLERWQDERRCYVYVML